MIRSFLSKKTLILLDSTSIDSVLREMSEKNISSALIKNSSEEIVGIVTERDVLKNIATLDVDRKLSRPIRVIMSRPVKFVAYDNIVPEIQELLSNKSLRHFPVVKKSDDNSASNVMGMLTATDFFNLALNLLTESQ